MVLTLALILQATLAAGEGAAATSAPAAPAATSAPAAPAAPAPAAPAAAVVAAAPPVTAIPPAIPMASAPAAAAAEKLAQGDRALAGGDLRGALFAYLDAVYAQPAYVLSRLKLGRAYLALRYPAFAIAQAEKVLAADPGNADAKRLVEDARTTPPARPAPAPPTTTSARAAEPSAPRVYRLTPDPAPARAAAAIEAVPQPPPPTLARQSYLNGLELISRREYTSAIAALDDAIASDPRLAVAYAARASARFGLRRYRDAADDYKAALGLDASSAMPLYGLAECYRLLGDPAAAQMYERYAASRAPDVREDLRGIAAERAKELTRR